MKTDYSDIELLKNADWIGIDRRFCRSVVMFHYKFHCENTEITDAKMIIACTGSYRILINHRPVNGDTIEINFETSGVQAFKYDIADFLKSENAMSVQVAGKMKLSEILLKQLLSLCQQLQHILQNQEHIQILII